MIIPNDTGRSPGPTVRESERASNCRQERVLPLGASATAGRRAPARSNDDFPLPEGPAIATNRPGPRNSVLVKSWIKRPISCAPEENGSVLPIERLESRERRPGRIPGKRVSRPQPGLMKPVPQLAEGGFASSEINPTHILKQIEPCGRAQPERKHRTPQ